jgi:hypothetical protein
MIKAPVVELADLPTSRLSADDAKASARELLQNSSSQLIICVPMPGRGPGWSAESPKRPSTA